MRCEYRLVIECGSDMREFTYKSTIPFDPRIEQDVSIKKRWLTVTGTHWDDVSQVLQINVLGSNGNEFSNQGVLERVTGYLCDDGWIRLSNG